MKFLLHHIWQSILLLSFLSISFSAQGQNLHIYCEDDPPFQFRMPDGTLDGMTIELVREIQKRVENTDQIEMVPWARGLTYLNKEPNTVLFSMSRTAERNNLYQWVGPIAESAYTFYVKSNSRIVITNLEQAKKIGKIGVYRDDIRDQYLTKLGFMNLDRVNNNVLNFKKLMADRIDMLAGSPDEIKSNAELAGYKLSDVKPVFVFLRSQIYIAMSKKIDPAIVLKWNIAMENMKKDGSFKTIFKKYLPKNSLPGPAITKF